MTNFNTKETYLAARAEWKANYARLSNEARAARKEFTEAASLFGKTSYRDHTAYWANYHAMEALRGKRDDIRRETNAALAQLISMREEAAAQWEAARALA